MEAQTLRVLTFNISGDNRSALSPDRFTLVDKYRKIAQLAIAADPHLISLQEVFPHTDVLAEALLEAGFLPCGEVESHCGFTQLWVHSRLKPQELPFRVGPVAVCRIPLPLPGGGSGQGAPAAAEQGSEAAEDEPTGARWLFFAGKSWRVVCLMQAVSGCPVSHPLRCISLLHSSWQAQAQQTCRQPGRPLRPPFLPALTPGRHLPPVPPRPLGCCIARLPPGALRRWCIPAVGERSVWCGWVRG